MGKRVVRAAVLLGVALGVVGCSSPGGTTCAEFGERDSDAQMTILMRMIEDHGLDPTSNVIGTARIGVDVNTFCGIEGIAGGSPATKNQSIGIENAVDWDSYGS